MNAKTDIATIDALDRKLYQAAGLSAFLVGEGHEAFMTYNRDTQAAVLWLLHETIAAAASLSDRMGREVTA